MLRVVAHQSAAAARQYYAEGLKREDYYSEGQEVVGKWHGRAAEKLGLTGDVTPDAFAALVENRNPVTGERLTPRTKADRRVGYDLNFHAPKSLSVLHALTGDDDVVKVFREAVAETMKELEERTGARVRRSGAKANRITGNLAWAEFVHFTARPVGGIPDPHLHVHCFAFNATFDSAENRWKAADFHDIKRDAPYAEAAFHARLTAKLAGLGYGIRRTKAGWEIAGIPQAVIDKFSRRTAQIERYAQDMGITDARAKDALGAATREGKRHGMTYSDLLAAWGVRLTEAEKVIISKVRYDRGEGRAAEKITAAAAVDYAVEKMFARDSVVVQKRLVAEALRHGVGQVKPDQVWRELARREMVVGKVGNDILCTTLDVLAEEVSLINFVRSGRGMCAPLKTDSIRFGNEKLSAEQRAAVKHILTTADHVAAVRGVAGAGKTTLMKEVAEQIEAGGLKVFAFAQSASASRETLREAGFAGADTVAHLLLNKNLQKEIHGQVLWLDEAGLLGTRELWEVMQVARYAKHVILTGDSGQHAPVARGDAFGQLQKYAGLPIVEVTEIRRQEQEIYKKTVGALSRGDLPNAFQNLDRLGAIVEIEDDGERYRALAQDFMSLSRKGSPPLIVSPTHSESAKVTEAIREAKRDAGQLKSERSFTRYHNLQWENADKKRAENYREGLVVQFHQNAKGIKRGAIFHVTGQDDIGTVRMTGTLGREIAVPLKEAQRFQVFEEREIRVGKGEQIRITRNGESADGRRLNNGNTFTVEKFKKDGAIVLSNGAELDAKHGHFTYGYCQTSHSSQSKSVRDVLVAQSEESFVASSREQFYVSVSRGKESIRIYTDSRRGLQEAVGNTAARQSAVELAGLRKRDISAMNTQDGTRQWREAVKSRVAEGDARTHVKNLLQARRQDVQKKTGGMNWRQYVEMRRGLTGTDGKSRSKGQPQPLDKKGGSIANKRRSFLRPTELTKPTTDRLKAAHEAKKSGKEPPKNQPGKRPSEPIKERLANSYRSAVGHFNRVVGRAKAEQFGKLEKSAAPQQGQSQDAAKGKQAANTHAAEQAKTTQAVKSAQQAKPQAKPLPRSNLNQVVDHVAKQQAQDAGKAAGQAAKVAQQVKAKAPVPPPPVPRK
jgi:conjugative relaxase-like TrwC/TraI family protein